MRKLILLLIESSTHDIFFWWWWHKTPFVQIFLNQFLVKTQKVRKSAFNCHFTFLEQADIGSSNHMVGQVGWDTITNFVWIFHRYFQKFITDLKDVKVL